MNSEQDLLALIGPLPEQPQTPTAPTPWRCVRDDSGFVYDVNGVLVAEFVAADIAALVVKLVNAAATSRCAGGAARGRPLRR
ncbi:hypothetical protein [Amycolatopsis kentuckyensis]|uniref:hypothetical protein n=1 Tax=Amycolatopsis kentuckyensis TaxID=218823 RepID=UPI000A3B184F|nr:hypothetical protein [Amycolatopsis kentuckyensis]